MTQQTFTSMGRVFDGRRPVIAVDLDGTLAHYDGWKGETHIGAPVVAVRDRVLKAHSHGWQVYIYTARLAHPKRTTVCAIAIDEWQLWHPGHVFPKTCTKLVEFDEFWDDKAVSVGHNTGIGVAFAADTLWSQLGETPLPTKRGGAQQLSEAFGIFARYSNEHSIVSCEHDVMYVLLPPSVVSGEDKETLRGLGFRTDDEGGRFYSFQHGSCLLDLTTSAVQF